MTVYNMAVMGQFRDKGTHIPDVVRRHEKTSRVTSPPAELSDDSVAVNCKVFLINNNNRHSNPSFIRMRIHVAPSRCDALRSAV